MQNRGTERATDDKNESQEDSVLAAQPVTETKNGVTDARAKSPEAANDKAAASTVASEHVSTSNDAPAAAQKSPSVHAAPTQPKPARKPNASRKQTPPRPSTQQGAGKASSASPQARQAQARVKRRPVPAPATQGGAAAAPGGARATGPNNRTAPRSQSTKTNPQGPKASGTAQRRPQTAGAGAKRPAGTAKPAAGSNTTALARRPVSSAGKALAKRPSPQPQQKRAGRHFSAAGAKGAPTRVQAAKLRNDKVASTQSDTTTKPQNKDESTPTTAIVLVKSKLSSLPFPSVVLPSKKQKIPSEENATGNVDSRTPFAKAKAVALEKIRTPQVAAVAILVLIYLIGSAFWSFRYLPGTKINGLDASWATPNGLSSRIEGEITSYSASAHGEGVDLSINAGDIDLSFDADTWKEAAHGYLPSFGWPIQLITKRDYQVTDGVSFDEKKLEGMVTAAVESANKDAKEPKNATFKFDEKKDLYVAVKEEQGTAVNLSHSYDTIKQGVSALQADIPITLADLSVPTLTITSSDYASVLEQANQLAHMTISLTYNGKEMYSIDDELVRSWLTINKSNTVTADLDKVTEWTRGPFSLQTDTVGTERTYTRTDDGKRITVAGGTYGWSVDGKKLANLIRTHITAHSDEPIEVPMISSAHTLVRGAQDWGPRYIDVDLSEQYVRMFDEDSNIIVEAPCVTGNFSQGQSTVEGVYYIEYKESPAVLVGLDYDYDGVADYETPVNYWMPFYGGYGLHDAYWRDYFGADVFAYDGSHGCVNLPYYAAEAIYSYADAGDVVVVHW